MVGSAHHTEDGRTRNVIRHPPPDDLADLDSTQQTKRPGAAAVDILSSFIGPSGYDASINPSGRGDYA